MKILPLLTFLFIFTSCNDNITRRSSISKINEPETPQTEQSVHSIKTFGNLYLSPKVEIDETKNEILITGHSGATSSNTNKLNCGLDFWNGDILSYTLDKDKLLLTLNGEELEFKRIHSNIIDNGIFGDWTITQTDSYISKTMTFYIREAQIMNVDVYCVEAN